ncbi:MAG: cytochrome C oxidase subunit IV family protein [Lutibacter sp.]|nr:cytochrome C oxidase subunit IV family protein [Lutibacter sp.]
MKKQLFIKVLLLLIGLTTMSALVANGLLISSFSQSIIIFLSILKFIGVSFYFMELKKAHIFWKSSVLIFLIMFSVITIIIV